MESAREPDPIPLVPLRPIGAAAAERPAPAASPIRLGSLRPRGGVGGILDLAASLLRARFGLLVGSCTLLCLPLRALQPWFGAHRLTSGDVGLQLAGLVLLFFGNILVQLYGQGLLVLLLQEEAEGRRPRLAPALGRTLVRLPAILLVSLLGGLAAAMGFCLLFVPGLLALWKLSLLVPVLVAEKVGVSRSLERSLALTKGSFGRFLGAFAVGWIASTLCGGLAGAFDDPTVRALVLEQSPIPELALDLALIPLSSLGLGLGLAVLGSVSYAYFLDCLARREGRDLERELEELGSELGRAPAAGSLA